MPISIDQWHVTVSLFGACRYAAIIKKDFEIFKFKSFTYPSVFLQPYNFSTFGSAWWYWNQSRTQKKQPKYFSCCHWNVNILLAHNKISLLTAYSTIHQYVICISETFLDSSVTLDDQNLSIQGHSLIQAHGIIGVHRAPLKFRSPLIPKLQVPP